jgi:hypothetical protein
MSVTVSHTIAGYFEDNPRMAPALCPTVTRDVTIRKSGGGGNSPLTNHLHSFFICIRAHNLIKYFEHLNIIAARSLYCVSVIILLSYQIINLLNFLLPCYNMHCLKIC